MEIRIRYKNNRVDVFDTDTFTKSEPFGNANMLTDFEILFDLLGTTGIWLAAHSYDANPSYRSGAEVGSTPVARRRRGWRFLLAESAEVDEIETVSIGGDMVLQRICDELVDVLRLDETACAWVDGSDGMSTAGKIVALFETLSRVGPADAKRKETARMCGCSLALVNALQSIGVSVGEGGKEAEDGWMEGLDHEDVD